MISEAIARYPWLWTLAWQSTICLAAGLAASYLLRRRAVRAHQVLLLSLIAAMLIPAVSQVVKRNRWGLFEAKRAVPEPQRPALPPRMDTMDPPPPIVIGPRTLPVAPQLVETASVPRSIETLSAPAVAERFDWSRAIVPVWLAAGSILLLRMATQFLLGRRIMRRSEAIDEPRITGLVEAARDKLGIGTAVAIRTGRHLRSPVIWCWAHTPILLIPRDSLRDSELDWMSILCHELAHWRRRDHLSGLFAELTICVLPWQPLAWWARKRLVALSEEACDDWVLASGQTPTTYAKTLLGLAPQNHPAVVPGVVSTHKSLAGRIHRILKSQCVNPRSGLRWTLAAALLTTCVGLGIAFAQTSVRDPHEPNSPSQKESENKLDRATLTGKVHDRQGKPVPDAKIMLYRIVGSRFQPLLRRAELLEQRRSSDDGTFSIVVPNKRDQGCIIVQKEGLAIGGADWWMGEDSKCDILLDRPEELTGYVVDENDRPVVDAQVSIVEGIIRTRKHRERVDYLSWPVSSCMDVKTDENGRFTFRNLPAESRVSLRVRKAGLATVQDDYGRARLSPGQSEVKLVMPPEASVKGIVRNRADGRPMPDIRVVAVPMMAWPSPEEQFRSVAAVSAGDGGFRIGGLPAIRYTIQLEPPVRGMAEWVAEPVDVSLAAGETIDGVELELMKGGVLEVLVTDSTTGKPIDNAEILVTDSERQQYPSLESCTDSTGVARFRVLPGDHAVQTVDAGTYNRQWHDQISVADGQTRQFVLALIPYSKIAGVVRDPDGNPLKGVELGVSGSGLTESSVVTDANGRFELSWVAGDIDINTPTGLIVARDAERNLATAVQIDSQTRSLNLKLEPGVTLTGRILSFEGTPLVNAAVVVLLHESDAFFDANLQWTFTAAANGSFEVKALPAGQQYEIRAYAKGHGDGVVLVDNQSVSNNHFDVGTIKPPRANLSVSGVVVDSDGLPVTGVDVAYCRKNGRPVSLPETPFSRTDSEGKFTINGVWEGPIHLAVLSHSGFHIFADLDTHGGATDVKIVAAGHSSAGRSQADGGEQVSLLPDWRPRFNEIYHLADGEILKRIAPPFIPERMEYCRNEYDHHEAEPYQLISRWDEQLEPMRMAWGPEGLGTLSNVLEDVLELKTYEYDGPQSLLDIELPGDWIVRDKASQEVKLRAFERLLAREFQRAIQFERRLVERSAIVATGKFKFHPPVGTSDNTSVHLYVTDADSDMISDIGTANSLDEFLRAIGGNLNMPLINRTEPQGRVRISYRCHTYVAQAAGIPNEQLREKFWRTVLDHLTEQTELQFEIRTEPVPVWQVIELAE